MSPGSNQGGELEKAPKLERRRTPAEQVGESRQIEIERGAGLLNAIGAAIDAKVTVPIDDQDVSYVDELTESARSARNDKATS
ncbi:MAG: hypothetical protein M3P98_02035 [bacterium]|nr:hypothetical protein [bacterium]